MWSLFINHNYVIYKNIKWRITTDKKKSKAPRLSFSMAKNSKHRHSMQSQACFFQFSGYRINCHDDEHMVPSIDLGSWMPEVGITSHSVWTRFSYVLPVRLGLLKSIQLPSKISQLKMVFPGEYPTATHWIQLPRSTVTHITVYHGKCSPLVSSCFGGYLS